MKVRLSKMQLQWQAPVKALEKWQPEVKASQDANINIYEEIGEGFYSSGMTSKIVSSILRNSKGEDITVNINSAGGDMFEGLAIYNILKDYEGKVKIKVVGMAASAASIIAMAGDEIEIGESAFFMIHNAWSVVLGNKDDFLSAAEDFAKFDDAMCSIYAKKTSMGKDEIAEMMNKETWIVGKDAVEMGFASSIMGEEVITEDENIEASALRKVDIALAKSGVTRSERRKLIKSLTGTQNAAKSTQNAGNEEVVSALLDLQLKLNNLTKKDK